MRSSAAENPAAAPGLLAALATDDDWWVRAGVASNTAAAPHLLEALAHDPDSGVRHCLCHNDKTPQHGWWTPSEPTPDYWVRAAAVAACEKRRSRAA